MSILVIKEKVKNPKHRPSIYREQKIAAHTTIKGKGKIGRLMKRKTMREIVR
jgi:hypothetical protein